MSGRFLARFLFPTYSNQTYSGFTPKKSSLAKEAIVIFFLGWGRGFAVSSVALLRLVELKRQLLISLRCVSLSHLDCVTLMEMFVAQICVNFLINFTSIFPGLVYLAEIFVPGQLQMATLPLKPLPSCLVRVTINSMKVR